MSNPLTPEQEYLLQLGHRPRPLLSVMRAKCLDCVGSPSEVRKCPAKKCPHWPYRFMKNPWRKSKKGSPATVAAIAKARAKKAERNRANLDGVPHRDDEGDAGEGGAS